MEISDEKYRNLIYKLNEIQDSFALCVHATSQVKLCYQCYLNNLETISDLQKRIAEYTKKWPH